MPYSYACFVKNSAVNWLMGNCLKKNSLKRSFSFLIKTWNWLFECLSGKICSTQNLFLLIWFFLRLKCKQGYWFSRWKCSHSFLVYKGSPEKIKFSPFFWKFFFNPLETFLCLRKINFMFEINLLKWTPALKLNFFFFRFVINVKFIFLSTTC